MTTPEGKLKAKVKAFLKERGAYFFMPVPSGYGTPTLDFIGCYKGRFFAIETKAPGKKPTPRQQVTMDDMQFKGGAFVFFSDDITNCCARLDQWFLIVDNAEA